MKYINGKTYYTISEMARKWGVSDRRVAQMCNETYETEDGEIRPKLPGAIKDGRMWLIPEDAKKPDDGRVTAEAADDANVALRNMMNNALPMDSILGLRKLGNESVDLIMCEVPFDKDKSGRKALNLNRLWTEYHRVVKPEGYVVLLTSGIHTAEVINSNPREFKYKLVWANSHAKEALGAAHMDVCVFSPEGNGHMDVLNISEAETRQHLFKLSSIGRDLLSFEEFMSLPVEDDKRDKQALGAYLACAFTQPGDLVVDNAGYMGDLVAGALFAGRNVICIEKDVQRTEKTEPEMHYMGTPDMVAAYMRSMRSTERTVTEYYTNKCRNRLLGVIALMPQERRASLDQAGLVEEFERSLSETGEKRSSRRKPTA